MGAGEEADLIGGVQKVDRDGVDPATLAEGGEHPHEGPREQLDGLLTRQAPSVGVCIEHQSIFAHPRRTELTPVYATMPIARRRRWE